MANIENFEVSEDIQKCKSVYLESSHEEHSSEYRIKSKEYKQPNISLSQGQPGTEESWEESNQLQDCESVHLVSKSRKKMSKSKTKDEEEIDLMLAKSQGDLDALMEKAAGSIDLLLDSTSEKMDEYLLDKPADRKKSRKQKDIEVIEGFDGKQERKKSKKHKEGEDGEEESQTGDGEKKKKKRKRGTGKSTATSCATSRGASPTPSMAPTEIDDNGAEPQEKREGSSGPMTYEKPYRVPVCDRYKQITRDVNKLETTIHNLYEKEKLYKIRMMQQKYWHKPEAKLYYSNLEYQEKPYNQMMDYLDRKERGIIPEREPDRPKPNAFVSDYDKRTEISRTANDREEMEKEKIKRILSAPSPRDVIFSSTNKDAKLRDTLQSKKVQTDVPDIFIPHGPNQCVIPTRLSGDPSGATSMNKEVQTYIPVSQSVQTDIPVTSSSNTVNPVPSELHRPVSDVDDRTLAIAASMTRLAACRLEEARFERQREDKLIHMNNKLMDSLQSLGKCVENLAVDRAPVRTNQYNAMPSNVVFYQEQLARLDADTKRYKNQYLEQEPYYTPGNISYHEHPFENIKESGYANIKYDNYNNYANYAPCYKETKKQCITDQDVTSMLSEIKASRGRSRARTEEEFEEQEAVNVFVDKFDPNWKFDTTLLEDKDRVKTAEIVHSNYMRVRHAQLRASQRNAIHGH